MHKASASLLIIDDDDVVRESLAAYLEDSGFKVTQATNGLEGLKVFEHQLPDLVICDLRMPQMDGLELIRRIRQMAVETPVIVLSGAGVMSDAVEALRLGAADYLIKPLEDLAVLEHSVRRALDRAFLRVGKPPLPRQAGNRQPRTAGQPEPAPGRPECRSPGADEHAAGDALEHRRTGVFPPDHPVAVSVG